MSGQQPTMMENLQSTLHNAGEAVTNLLPSKIQNMLPGHEQDTEIQKGKQYPLEGASVHKKITEDASGQDWSATKKADDKVNGVGEAAGDKEQGTLSKMVHSVTDVIGSTYNSIKENVVGNEEARLRGHEEDKERPVWAVDEEEEGGLSTDEATFGLEGLSDAKKGKGKRGQLKDFHAKEKKAPKSNIGQQAGNTKPMETETPEDVANETEKYDTSAFDAPLNATPYTGGKLNAGAPGKIHLNEECCDKDKKKHGKWAKGRHSEQRDLRVAAQKLGHFSEQTIKSADPESLEKAGLPLNY